MYIFSAFIQCEIWPLVANSTLPDGRRLKFHTAEAKISEYSSPQL